MASNVIADGCKAAFQPVFDILRPSFEHMCFERCECHSETTNGTKVPHSSGLLHVVMRLCLCK
jgi:hypothetical protein